ncbi:MAG: polysaccharide lyase [Planctomycetes bacterium]|nr:polysaccharide lyase [Planctomycetota bacterium]
MRTCVSSFVAVLLSWSIASNLSAGELTETEAIRALEKAVHFFRNEVSAQGGYLWRCSADLSKREGEGRAGPLTAWVQPPGTPTVGDGYLVAYRLSGRSFLLDAARETGLALVRGQLRSGGWDYRIEFDPKQRKRYAYRVDGESAGRRNVSTLDDDNTQSAIRFLMHLDEALGFRDAEIHEAVQYALDSLVKVQYPNGAWPQRFTEPPDPKRFPVKRASYPKSWSRTWPHKNYASYYTFNDNTIADVIRTLLEAAEIYKDGRYLAAARKGGDFILLAQMPDPQPAWAQQYDADMHPAWARKFEPPAITGGESQGVMRILMTLYQHTADRKYLEPIPRALDYLKRSLRPDGRLARFYELRTNRPLYFTKDYQLTYSDADMPTHYAFVVPSTLDRIASQYEALLKTPRSELKPSRRRARPVRWSRSLEKQARSVVAAMDGRGAWVESGTAPPIRPSV